VQVIPQPPQLFGSVSTGVSQPLPTFVSQLAKPPRQLVIPHSPVVQIPNPLVTGQLVRSGCCAPEHVPVNSSQIPAARHAVAVPHATSEPPQTPPLQRSLLVHNNPSSHTPALLAGGASHRPAAALQTGVP
jgi:hypothetical protein